MAKWRAISCTLANESQKWKAIDDHARVLWLQIMLRCDSWGALEGGELVVWTLCTKRLGWTLAQTSKAFRKLLDQDLIRAWEHDDSDWLAVVDFDDHQPSDFLRKRGARLSPIPPDAPQGRPAGRPQKIEQEGRDREGDLKIPCRTEESDGDPVREVFDHWVAADTETGGKAEARILTAGRRSQITARIKEGYTVDQLNRAVSAFCRDPWHLGANDRKTRYTGLQTLLKNGGKVEAGLELAAAQERQPTSRYTNAVRLVDGQRVGGPA